MNHKSLLQFRFSRKNSIGSDTNAGMIVFLMMALVFVPIMAAHAAMLWHDAIGQIGTNQLAAITNMLVSLF